MLIGERLRDIRLARNMSQGEVEERTGLLRCYLSRVENGHTVPALETLEKLARALDVSVGALFYDGQEGAKTRRARKATLQPVLEWGQTRRERAYYRKMAHLLSRMAPERRELLLAVATKLAKRH